MTQTLIAGLALALTLGVAGASEAQEPVQSQPQTQHQYQHSGQKWQHGHRDGFKMLFKGITLTDQQKAQLQDLREKQGKKADKDKFQKVRDEAKEAREKGDTAKVREIRQDVRKEMQENREDMIKEVREILTPDQRTIFDRNVAELQQRFQGRGQRRGA